MTRGTHSSASSSSSHLPSSSSHAFTCRGRIRPERIPDASRDGCFMSPHANPPGGGGSLPNPNDCALPPSLTVLPSRGGKRRSPCRGMPAPPTSALDSGWDCISAVASVLRDPAAPLVLSPPQGSLLLRPDREIATSSGLAPPPTEGAVVGQGGLAARRRPVPGAHPGERAAGGAGNPSARRGRGGAAGQRQGPPPSGGEGEWSPNCVWRGAACRRGSREGCGRR
jgi:hypothetical protein